MYMTYEVPPLPISLVSTWYNTVIAELLPAFPERALHPPWLFCNYPFVFRNPFTSFTHSLTTLPLWQPSFCSLYLWVCSNSVCLLCYFGFTHKWNRGVCFFSVRLHNLFVISSLFHGKIQSSDLMSTDDSCVNPRITTEVAKWCFLTP